MELVTGGTGLVGAHLLHQLASEGRVVRAIYRTESSLNKCRKVFAFYQNERLFDHIQWVKADLLDIFSLEEALDGVSRVYHSAALVSFQPHDREMMMKVNIDGTANLVNLCLEKGIEKFCHFSSVAAIGKAKDGSACDEQTIWSKEEDTTAYSISKYYAENEVWRASEEGLKVVIVNPATILGYGDWQEGSLAIFRRVHEGLRYYTEGVNGFISVGDVVRFSRLLMDSNVVNERYILVGEHLSFKVLLQQIAKALQVRIPNRLATPFWAKVALWVERFRWLFLGKGTVLTKESISTAFAKRAFSADKAIQEFDFEFSPIDQTITEAANQFKMELEY